MKMLYDRIPETNDSREFWVPKKILSKSDGEKDKEVLANKIIKYFENFN